MPENLRDGSIFADPENLGYYLSVYFSAIIFFFITNYCIRLVFDGIGKKGFAEKDDPIVRQRYLEKWNSNLHHVIIFALVAWGYCNQKVEGSYPYIFFYDDVAFLTVNPTFVMIEMVYIGYIT